MAYAAIAGLPLVVGLYTALVPLVVYAVMGIVPSAERDHHLDDRHPDRFCLAPGRAKRLQ